MAKTTLFNLGLKIEAVLLWLSVFLLPWQLRHTIFFASVNGGYFEYGSWHVYVTDIVILMLLVVGVLVSGRRVLQPLAPAIGLPLLMMLLWMTITIFWATDKSVALVNVIHWWLFYSWCVYLVNRVKRIEQILWPLVVGTVFQAGWGTAQYIVNHSLGLNWLGESVLDPTKPGVSVVELAGFRHLRAYGLLPHPNMLGGILVAGATSAVLLIKSQLARWQWVALWLGGMIISAGVALSFSRAAWLMLLVILLAAGVVGAWQKNGRKLMAVGLMLLTFMGVLASQRQYVTVRFDLSASLERQSVEERRLGFVEWRKIITQYSNQGVGLGNYTMALIKIEPNREAWWYAPVHDIYLLMTGELGAFGMAVWIWLIVMLGKLVWTKRRKLAMWEAATPLLVWLGLGLTDHWPFSLQQGQLLFFLALALIILTSRSMIGGEQEA